MRINEGLVYAFEQITEEAVRTVSGLDRAALVWRPDAGANPIAWLAWHLARVADVHVAEIAGREDLWVTEGWAQRFGLPSDYRDHGYGHTPDQVSQIAPYGPEPLVEYLRSVGAFVTGVVAGIDDFGRIIDDSYDPPVSVGVRLHSVIADGWQHVGQAAYVRGLYERQTP